MTDTWKPEGWHTVTPRIVTPEPRQLVDFLHEAFGATGVFHPTRPTEMRIGDSIVMVSGDDEREPMTAFLYVYVEDTDQTHDQAVRAGARSLEPPQNLPYGDRRAMVRDAWGNTWQIATRLR